MRNPENAVVLRLLAATGCRRGEVCGLQWQDIDFGSDPVGVLIRRAVLEIDKQFIVQGTKNHAVRNVGLDAETADMLREHRAQPHRRWGHRRGADRSVAASLSGACREPLNASHSTCRFL